MKNSINAIIKIRICFFHFKNNYFKNIHFSFSKTEKISNFTPKKIKNLNVKIESSKDDIVSKRYTKLSLLENSPTKERSILKSIINKNRVFPKQHAKNMENEDTNIISYKDKPLALNEEFTVPEELYVFKGIEFESPEFSKQLDIGIIGSTNSGKSSLINILCNSNISSVSPKSNTTEEVIEGIFTDLNSKTQICLYDTPGAYKANRHSILASNILTRSWSILSDVDKVIYLVDSVKRIDRVSKMAINRFFKLNNSYLSRKLSEKLKENNSLDDIEKYTEEIKKEIKEVEEMKKNEDSNENIKDKFSYYSDQPIPTILVLNKVDLVTNKRKLKALETELDSLGKFEKIFYISCETGYGIDELKNYLISQSYERKWKYHPSIVTSRSEVDKLEEVVKQNIYKRSYNEVPFETSVILKSWVPLTNGELRCFFNIEVKDRNVRKILIGREGINIKEIRQQSEKDLTILFNRPVKIEIGIICRRIKNIKKANAISGK